MKGEGLFIESVSNLNDLNLDGDAIINRGRETVSEKATKIAAVAARNKSHVYMSKLHLRMA